MVNEIGPKLEEASQIGESFGALQNTIGALDELTLSLMERLDVAMHPNLPTDVAELPNKNVVTQMAPLAEMIRGVKDHAADIQQRLVDIMNRLELP